MSIKRSAPANASMAQSVLEDAHADGRRRRSQDSRARIVTAMLGLIRSGEVAPGAEHVAERAQVGLRTVFRHFTDMDSLYREMSYVIEGELLQVVATAFKAADWKGRVLELVERRSQAYEKIAPFKHASNVHRHTSRFLSGDHDRLAVESREILKRLLPPDAAGDALKFETLDLLLSFEAWSRLRREQGLTPKKARDVLETGIRRVLEG